MQVRLALSARRRRKGELGGVGGVEGVEVGVEQVAGRLEFGALGESLVALVARDGVEARDGRFQFFG